MGPPERIVAGVVLCERLAVGMYGAVHRAQREGHRHLRALVVEQRLLAEPGFHRELMETSEADKVIALSCDQIVPTLAIESEGPDVVVLTRGVGRYVTVQDMLASARARGFKIERSVVAAVAIAAGDALAAAHKAHVVHGAVHPRSVLVDEEGAVRLTDFGVGRALTSAVSQGGDSTLWRGLAGFLAPELAIGAMPGPESDVFSLGALVFVMLTGDAPPGALATTPAVERVVTKALDTESGRRYRHPGELAEALRSAFATDGWAIASPTDIIAAAGLQTEATGLDSDTEDLLAALGSAAPAPVRPSADLRAEVVAARVSSGKETGRLDALLADLGEDEGEGAAASRKRRTEPPPAVTSRDSQRSGRGRGAAAKGSPLTLEQALETSSELALDAAQDAAPAAARDAAPPLTSTADAALDALSDLRGDPTLPPSKPALTEEPALASEPKKEAKEKKSKRVEPSPPLSLDARAPLQIEPQRRGAKKPPGDDSVTTIHPSARRAAAIVDLPADAPVPSLRRSPLWAIASVAVLVAAGVGAVMLYQSQKAERAAAAERSERAIKEAQELSAKLTDDLPDPGSIRLSASPSPATGWLLLGRTPFDSLPLSSEVVHQVRVELERHRTQELNLDGTSWQGVGGSRRAEVKVKLERSAKADAPLSAAVAPPPPGKALAPGSGKIRFESDPSGAAVWLYIGVTGSIQFAGIAGQPYELRALKDGFLPGYARVSADDWRAIKGGKPVEGPIDSVAKKPSIDVEITLTPDPEAPAEAGGAPRRRGS
jgi:hypothetical protein